MTNTSQKSRFLWIQSWTIIYNLFLLLGNTYCVWWGRQATYVISIRAIGGPSEFVVNAENELSKTVDMLSNKPISMKRLAMWWGNPCCLKQCLSVMELAKSKREVLSVFCIFISVTLPLEIYYLNLPLLQSNVDFFLIIDQTSQRRDSLTNKRKLTLW